MTTCETPVELTADNYHSDLTRDSNSSLNLFRSSVARYAAIRVKHTMTPPEPTDEMIFGTHFHTCLLEPERFERTYRVAPDVDRRYKEGKAAYQDFVDSLRPDQLCLKIDEYKKLLAMRDAVYANPKAFAAIDQAGDVERIRTWDDPLTGAPLKMKADKETERSLLIDVKTCGKDLSPDFLQRTIYNFCYHSQAALYLDGYRANTGEDAEFAFLFVSKEPPHETAVVVLDSEALERGRWENRATLLELQDRRSRGDWNGRTHDTVLTIGLPRWAFTKN